MCEWSLCHSLNPASPFSRYFNKTIYLSGHITRMFYRPKNPRRALRTPQLERRLLKTSRHFPKTSIYSPAGPEWVHIGGNVVENIIPKKRLTWEAVKVQISPWRIFTALIVRFTSVHKQRSSLSVCSDNNYSIIVRILKTLTHLPAV